MTERKRRIIVGMSGGVDSSVAALLLQQSGQDLAGLFMKNWEDDDDSGQCQAEQDAEDARRVADALGIQFHARNFAAEYWDSVFENFIAEYRAGRTPNPDVLCNREIKFKVFLEHAEDLGGTHIATGHYARCVREGNRWRLLKAKDGNKDQSYFLYQLGQAQLAKTIFPLGDMAKPEVRRLAEAAGFAVHDKKDSTGICFIGERRFREFLSRYVQAQEGDLVSVQGERLGQHPGVSYFTIGQRQGLGIGGKAAMSGEPWYVVGKDIAGNRLIVGQGVDNPHLFSTRLVAWESTWVAGDPPADAFECRAKTRYRQADQACRVYVADDGALDVTFSEPQRAVTPGQSLVLYRDDECLGGGIIAATNATYGGLD